MPGVVLPEPQQEALEKMLHGLQPGAPKIGMCQDFPL